MTLKRAGLALVFVWFIVGGAAHFVFTSAFLAIMPDYVPAPRFWVLFTGLCEIAGALALLGPQKLRSIAGICLAVLAVCVTPANIEMLQHADDYPRIGAPLLWVRLLFQPVFIWIVWASTRPAQR